MECVRMSEAHQLSKLYLKEKEDEINKRRTSISF